MRRRKQEDGRWTWRIRARNRRKQRSKRPPWKAPCWTPDPQPAVRAELADGFCRYDWRYLKGSLELVAETFLRLARDDDTGVRSEDADLLKMVEKNSL